MDRDMDRDENSLKLLSAGAARSLILALSAPFHQATGVELDANFATAGSTASAFFHGAPCDVLILTGDGMVALVERDQVRMGSCASLGRVETGIAARLGDPLPDISTAAALRDALLAAPALYLPDPETSTGGAHLRRVVQQLGIADTVASRLRPQPSGSAAMEALAASAEPGVLACAQMTEIRSVAGGAVVGALPGDLGLATEYMAGIPMAGARAKVAEHLVRFLSGPESQAIREACGFTSAT
jgi:molybdate transport system substrate-binding protein